MKTTIRLVLVLLCGSAGFLCAAPVLFTSSVAVPVRCEWQSDSGASFVVNVPPVGVLVFDVETGSGQFSCTADGYASVVSAPLSGLGLEDGSMDSFTLEALGTALVLHPYRFEHKVPNESAAVTLDWWYFTTGLLLSLLPVLVVVPMRIAQKGIKLTND